MTRSSLAVALLLLACSRPDATSETGDHSPGPEDSDSQDDDTAPEDTAPTKDRCEDPCKTPSTASVESVLGSAAFSPNSALTRDNPLKGMMTSYLWGEPANDFPDQMEFLYIPMRDLWDDTGETLEDGLEPYLVAAEARGHHAVLRVYIDYPSKEAGMPEYLIGRVHCEEYTDYGGGCSPDYDDPDLVEAMQDLIAAMGTRYDADPRLGFVQVGLLGFWGEWHTWPYTEWFPTEETQETVLNAYVEAFPNTQLQVRKPAATSVELPIGYHDDSFGYSTIGDIDWFFLPGLEAAGAQYRWQEVPIGGELRPELQTTIFESDYETDTYAQDFLECVEATHATYMLNYQAFNEDGVGYSGDERETAETAALTLGYQFEIHNATLSATGLLEDTVEVSLAIEIAQTGVAPFYYPLFLTADSDALESTATATDDLQTLLPDENRTVTLDLGRVSVDVLNAPLTLQLTSPILQSSQSIAFATQTPWTGDTGAMTLQWEIGCEVGEEGDFATPGTVVGTTEEGCDCVCDVDGQSRACGEESCR